MPLFQNTVLQKYLQSADQNKITAAYEKFKAHFHNPEIQENIRTSKEEQYQGEFLIDLFVTVLGYVKNPQPGFNLTTEYKNVKDSKKADGAIIINNAVKAIIELKGTDTTDLGKVENQAFGYKNNQPDCVYVITSNFEKLRFYIDNAIEFLEFDLFRLDRAGFELLYVCLAFENLAANLPKKIKDESTGREDKITKELYKDYSLFKRELYQNLVLLNPAYLPLELFTKSQKLLDRFLFLLFAEDRHLLPPNSVRVILQDWRKLQELDEEIPLYNRFKKYFGYLNTGFKGQKHSVFAYNGGLFKPDPVLDNILIDDELLYRHTFKLSEYDFASEVDVNILGHIFENSLNELDEIKAQLAGQEIDKSKTKRKKDGVFYTPKYITKYIVENTVGLLCKEQKAALKLKEEDYTTDRKRQKATRQLLLDKLTAYRNWLLNLTICDPACGSGAFLNQALDFLISEHRYLDELTAKLFGDALVLSDVEKSILENNLFGVDLNEESVEIAKLSLWLRTAQPERKLNDLNNNLKCGNSLIDDPAVAGDKAFNWQQEFPQIFEKGGFDVIIGNPPYVNINRLPEIHNYLKSTYSEIHTGYNDLMYYFLYKGINILKDSGIYGVITSNYFIGNEYADKLRLFLNKHIDQIVNFEKAQIFTDASVHTTLVFAKKNSEKDSIKFYTYAKSYPIVLVDLNIGYNYCELIRKDQTEKWVIADNSNKEIIDKLFIQSNLLGNICEIEKGSTSGKNNIFTISYEFAKSNNFEIELLRKNVKNGDVDRYSLSDRGNYLIYTDNHTNLEQFPNIFSYLNSFKDELASRNEASKGLYKWFRLERPRNKQLFDAPEKLIVPYRASRNKFAYDNQQFFNDGGDIRIIVLKEEFKIKTKFILALLNSQLLNWFYGFIGKAKGDSREYFNKPLSEIPIKQISPEAQQPFIEKADLMLSLNKTLQETAQKVQRILQRKFNLSELPKKLHDWYLLSYGEFIKELAKKKVKLSLSEEAEWEDYFTQEAQKALALKTRIETTDKEIDQLVYTLYNLTEAEIKIVESA